MTLILPHHRPQPNPEQEQRVRQELKSLDPLLDVIWLEDLRYNARHAAFEGAYAYVVRWPAADPRWSMIQSGELGNTPYDILGFASEDMQDAERNVDLDQMEQRVLKLLASADNERMPWRKRMAAAAEKNRALKLKRKQDFLENETHATAEYHRNAALGIQQVSVPVEIK